MCIDSLRIEIELLARVGEASVQLEPIGPRSPATSFYLVAT